MKNGTNAAPETSRTTFASANGAAGPQVQYANFCRVTGSPEELMLDFATMAQPLASAGDDVAVDRRIIMTPFTAKRMLGALTAAVRHYEQVFGTIETDAAARVRNKAARRPAPRVAVRPRIEPVSSIEPDAGAVQAAVPANVEAAASAT